MKIIFALLLSCFGVGAHAADYVYTTFGLSAVYPVTGAFRDVIHFAAPADGAYTIDARGLTQRIGCTGRYCRSPGTFIATLSRTQLQTSLGTALVDMTGPTPVTLTAGAYMLVIEGLATGTGTAAGRGSYSLGIVAPVVTAPPPCDYLRDIMQTQGVRDATIEIYILALKALTPPGCLGD